MKKKLNKYQQHEYDFYNMVLEAMYRSALDLEYGKISERKYLYDKKMFIQQLMDFANSPHDLGEPEAFDGEEISGQIHNN